MRRRGFGYDLPVTGRSKIDSARLIGISEEVWQKRRCSMLMVDKVKEGSEPAAATSGKYRQRLFTGAAVMISLLLTALLGLTGCSNTNLDFPTEYQAVYLDNGQIFFGKLSDTGSSFPMLRDVFFVQTQMDRDKKESKHLLFKRGAIEGHHPDFMRLNAQHIVVIEPVAPDSRVAQLIREAKAPRPPETKEAPIPPAATPPVSKPPAAKLPGAR
jgi:hypothetical protein